ncbi:hypothetical protein ACTWQF_17090 [Streptomyces sp. 8N114]|uniref:hypothetical protein n=1 Tax=Streptomyces sp. 8N114 TaxID=3457419 RepID=UPI003FD26C52
MRKVDINGITAFSALAASPAPTAFPAAPSNGPLHRGPRGPRQLPPTGRRGSTPPRTRKAPHRTY